MHMGTSPLFVGLDLDSPDDRARALSRFLTAMSAWTTSASSNERSRPESAMPSELVSARSELGEAIDRSFFSSRRSPRSSSKQGSAIRLLAAALSLGRPGRMTSP